MAVTARRVTVGAVATELTTAPPGPAAGSMPDLILGGRITVRNRGAAAVFVGPGDVATTTGFELAVGEQLVLDLFQGERLYGIAAAAQRVDVLEQT